MLMRSLEWTTEEDRGGNRGAFREGLHPFVIKSASLVSCEQDAHGDMLLPWSWRGYFARGMSWVAFRSNGQVYDNPYQFRIDPCSFAVGIVGHSYCVQS